jgi:outer membrane biosynthesis protein TonB
MAIPVTKTTDEFPWIDAGVYDAVVTGIKQQEGKPDRWGKADPYLMWIFKIAEEVTKNNEVVDLEVSVVGLTSMKFSDKSKLGKWSVAAGLDVQVGDTIDLEEVIGKPVKITVTLVEKSGAKKNFVSDVNPAKRRARPAQAEKPAPKEEPVQDKKPEPKADLKPAPKQEAKPKPKPEPEPAEAEEVSESVEESPATEAKAEDDFFDWDDE